MTLRALNPHDLDERLAFDGPSHTYVVDGIHECRSATSLISKAFPAFDADEAIAAMRGGYRWNPGHPLHGMTDDEIKAVWSSKSEAASEAGSALHLLIEQCLNAPDPAGHALSLAVPEHPELTDGFVPFLRSLPPTMRPFRTEWAVFHKKTRLAGTIDAVFRDSATGKYVLYDWKRTVDVPYENQRRTGTCPAVAHLPDSKGAKYALQLSMYAFMLEETYGIVVSDICIVAMHPDMVGPAKFTVYPQKRLAAEVEALLAHKF